MVSANNEIVIVCRTWKEVKDITDRLEESQEFILLVDYSSGSGEEENVAK